MESAKKTNVVNSSIFISQPASVYRGASQEAFEEVNQVSLVPIQQAGEQHPKYYLLLTSGHITDLELVSPEQQMVNQIANKALATSQEIQVSEQAKEKKLSPLELLPYEVLSQIFSYILSRKDELAFSNVSKTLKQFVMNDKAHQLACLALGCMKGVSVYSRGEIGFASPSVLSKNPLIELENVVLSRDYSTAYSLYQQVLKGASSLSELYGHATLVSRALSKRIDVVHRLVPSEDDWSGIIHDKGILSELVTIMDRAKGIARLVEEDSKVPITDVEGIRALVVAGDFELARSYAKAGLKYGNEDDYIVLDPYQVLVNVIKLLTDSPELGHLQCATRFLNSLPKRYKDDELKNKVDKAMVELYEELVNTPRHTKNRYDSIVRYEPLEFPNTELYEAQARQMSLKGIDIVLPWIKQAPESCGEKKKMILKLWERLIDLGHIDRVWHALQYTLDDYSMQERDYLTLGLADSLVAAGYKEEAVIAANKLSISLLRDMVQATIDDNETIDAILAAWPNNH